MERIAEEALIPRCRGRKRRRGKWLCPEGGARSTAMDTGPANKTGSQQGTPANHSRLQQARPGGATSTTRMVHTDWCLSHRGWWSRSLSATVKTLTDVLFVWVPSEQDDGQQEEEEVPFSDRRVHEQRQTSPGCGATEVSLLYGHHGAWRRGAWEALLEDGCGQRIGHLYLREAGLCRLQQHFRGLTLVHPYEGGPSVSLIDSR